MTVPGRGTGGGRPLLIAFGYPDGCLPNPWFRAYKRAKRSMKRATYNVRVELRPMGDLPAEVDVLAVPPGLADRAGSVPGVLDLLVAPADALQAELDRLIARLVEERRLEHATAASRAVAIHRGFLPLTERGRLAE